MNLRNVDLPDLPSVSTPDVGNLTDELKDLAGAAADAVSSAAGHVPGLADYRAAARRRRWLTIAGVVAVVVVVAMVVRNRREDDTATNR